MYMCRCSLRCWHAPSLFSNTMPGSGAWLPPPHTHTDAEMSWETQCPSQLDLEALSTSVDLDPPKRSPAANQSGECNPLLTPLPSLPPLSSPQPPKKLTTPSFVWMSQPASWQYPCIFFFCLLHLLVFLLFLLLPLFLSLFLGGGGDIKFVYFFVFCGKALCRLVLLLLVLVLHLQIFLISIEWLSGR